MIRFRFCAPFLPIKYYLSVIILLDTLNVVVVVVVVVYKQTRNEYIYEEIEFKLGLGTRRPCMNFIGYNHGRPTWQESPVRYRVAVSYHCRSASAQTEGVIHLSKLVSVSNLKPDSVLVCT